MCFEILVPVHQTIFYNPADTVQMDRCIATVNVTHFVVLSCESVFKVGEGTLERTTSVAA